MIKPELNRRDFSRLTMAALSGLVGGAMAGCKDQETSTSGGGEGGGTGGGTDDNSAGAAAESGASAGGDGTGSEQKVAAHACRGLNTCQTADNACAGQSQCASKAWQHECGNQNDCKGQGGCGDTVLINECAGKGNCHVPLMPEAWTKARADFEAKMKKAGKTVGAAPPAKS